MKRYISSTHLRDFKVKECTKPVNLIVFGWGSIES